MPIAKILYNRYATVALLLLLVQQTIVASSTHWIARLVYDVGTGSSFTVDLALFVLSLTIPYVPGVASVVTMERWRQDARRSFVDAFVAANVDAVDAWSDPRERDSRTAFLAQESGATLGEAIAYIHDVVGTALNVLFNVLVIVAVVDYRFGIAYLASVVICVIILRATSRLLARKAMAAQQARVDLTSILMRGWDNIALGNRYNLALWRRTCEQRIDRTRDAAVAETLARTGWSGATALCCMAPVLGILVYLFASHAGHTVFLATLVATLPRQIMVINNVYVLVDYATTWSALAAKLEGVMAAARRPASTELQSRIAWSDITITRAGQAVELHRASDVRAAFQQFAPGRYTVRGRNGAGKSTLLRLIKQLEREDSLVLLADGQLCFENDTGTLSSGQARRARLQEIAATDTRILLLDEWDANLDADAIREVSAVIESLAASRCVIEVRHRHEP
jgi:ABC-type bacteriocin/lantibiotic exporter with double-glycine peptidase domain